MISGTVMTYWSGVAFCWGATTAVIMCGLPLKWATWPRLASISVLILLWWIFFCYAIQNGLWLDHIVDWNR